MIYEGYEVTDNTITNGAELYKFILEINMSGEDVFNLFIDWHGTQLCTADFLENTFRVEYGMDADTPD